MPLSDGNAGVASETAALDHNHPWALQGQPIAQVQAAQPSPLAAQVARQPSIESPKVDAALRFRLGSPRAQPVEGVKAEPSAFAPVEACEEAAFAGLLARKSAKADVKKRPAMGSATAKQEPRVDDDASEDVAGDVAGEGDANDAPPMKAMKMMQQVQTKKRPSSSSMSSVKRPAAMPSFKNLKYIVEVNKKDMATSSEKNIKSKHFHRAKLIAEHAGCDPNQALEFARIAFHDAKRQCTALGCSATKGSKK